MSRSSDDRDRARLAIIGLAHTYDDILDEHVMLTIHEDLPVLDVQLATIFQALDS